MTDPRDVEDRLAPMRVAALHADSLAPSAALYERLLGIATAMTAATAESDIANVVIEGLRVALRLRNAALWIEQEGTLVLVGASGYSPSFHEQFDRLALDSVLPVAVSARTGEALFFESREVYATHHPNAEVATRPRGSPDVAFACLPVPLDDRRAIIALAYDDPHVFEDDERRFLRLLAAQTGHALERASLVRMLRASTETLARSEARYRQLLESARDGVWAIASDRTTTFVSRRMAEMLGYSPDEMVGRDILDFAPPEERDEIMLGLARRRAGAADVRYTQVLHKSGHRRWMRVAASPLPEGEQNVGSLAFFSDITEERRGELHRDLLARISEALSPSAEYRSTLPRVAELIVPGIADFCEIAVVEDGVIAPIAIAHVNPDDERRFREALTGRERRIGDGSPVASVIETGQTRFFERVDDATLKLSARTDAELAAFRSIEPVSSVVAPIVAGGERLGILVIGTAAASGRVFDRSDKSLGEELARRVGVLVANARAFERERQARERITRLQEITAALARASTPEDIGAVVTDYVLRSVGASNALLYATAEDALTLVASLGFDEQEIERIRSVPVTSDLPAARALRERTAFWVESVDDMLARFPAAAELRERLAQRPRAFATVPLLVGGAGVGVLAYGFHEEHAFTAEERAHVQTVVDHCAQTFERARLFRAAEESAARAKEALLRAEEANRIKDEFLATVSHELRTPLNAIAGWASMLVDRPHDPATLAKGLRVIERNAHAQTKLVEDVLDVSRIINGKLKIEPKPVDLVAIARDAIDVVSPSATAKEIAIALESEHGSGLLIGDPQRLQQVVWNLLSNAVKFTDPRGRIHVRVAQSGATLSLRVTDDGQGIAADVLPHVFERFRQGDGSTTRKHGGLGLGLAIVRHIVELHGGSVRAESEGPGRGACFEVSLPVRALVPRAADREPAQGKEDDARSEVAVVDALEGVRVLVVDDEADARDMVLDLLETHGAIVATAASAEDALEAVGSFRPDLLVSDIGMPVHDGYWLLARIRELPRDRGGALAAVALTAYARADDRRRALVAGFNTHVAKPVDPRELVAILTTLATTFHTFRRATMTLPPNASPRRATASREDCS